MAEKNVKLTPYQQEMINTAKKVCDYKLSCEANIVAILYKVPEEIHNIDITIKDFSNNTWKTYFQIAYDVIITEKKESLDEITIGLYLEKHPKLKIIYDNSGGYSTIQTATSYIKIENLNGYITELKKWKSVLNLTKQGFPVGDRLSEYVDMSAEEIYEEHEVQLNHIFANVDSEIKSYDICDGIEEHIEELDKGIAVGLPYYNMQMLTKETGGQYLGSITLIGGASGAGKSTIVRSVVLPSIIEMDEKIVIFANEESLKKWQRELLAWICNNVFNYDTQKHIIRNGGYTPEFKNKLYEAVAWLREKTKNHKITFIPFKQYKTSTVIKQIKKYKNLGVKYYILDTYKMDAGKVSSNTWLEMQQGMVDIHDTIKEESLNVHITITFQLEKGSTTMRYFTQGNIGLAKNIVDVASTCIMIRDLFDDEYTDEKKSLNVYRLEGKNNKTKIPVRLNKDKNYQLFFIVKNREGSSNKFQIVAEHDKSRNILKEIGITSVMPDTF